MNDFDWVDDCGYDWEHLNISELTDEEKSDILKMVVRDKFDAVKYHNYMRAAKLKDLEDELITNDNDVVWVGIEKKKYLKIIEWSDYEVSTVEINFD